MAAGREFFVLGEEQKSCICCANKDIKEDGC